MTNGTEAGRALQALRKQREFTCAVCEKPFTATQKKTKTCGDRCRKAYWRKQHRAKK